MLSLVGCLDQRSLAQGVSCPFNGPIRVQVNDDDSRDSATHDSQVAGPIRYALYGASIHGPKLWRFPLGWDLGAPSKKDDAPAKILDNVSIYFGSVNH